MALAEWERILIRAGMKESYRKLENGFKYSCKAKFPGLPDNAKVSFENPGIGKPLQMIVECEVSNETN